LNTLDFSKEYILENKYVKLITVSNDPVIWKYLLEKGSNKDDLTAYVSNAVHNRSIKKEYPFVVYDKIKELYAGTTRLYDYSKILNVVKLGHTWYGENFRRTQLNKNCKFLLFQFVFEFLKLERIGFGVHSENKVSIAALKSIGCQEEGALRNFIPSVDGIKRFDIILMSILRNEWNTSVKTKLKEKLTI